MKKKKKPRKKPIPKNPPKKARPKPGLKRVRSRSEGKKENFERTIFTKTYEGKNWRLVVGVFSYKGAKPKLLLTREHASRKYSNKPFAKLGRLSKEEVLGIMPIMEEALKHMR